MGNRHDGAFEIVQEAFQPRDGLCIQVVSRFVEQQHVWFFQQQAAQRDAAALTAGQVGDFRVPVRQTQGIRRALKLDVQVMAIVRLDNLFELALLSGELVEVGIRLRVFGVHLVQTFQGVDHFGHRFFNRLTDGLLRIELRLLRQIADFQARLRTGFAFDIGIDAGHDAQQGRLTGAVQTENADFCAREKAQGDIFQNMTFRRNHFADTMHGINELSHVGLRLFYILFIPQARLMQPE